MRGSVIALLATILIVSTAFAQETDPLPFTVAPHDPVTMVAEGPEGAHVTFEVVAYGGRDPNPVVTCDPPSGSLFPLGPTDVRCVATNSFGERAVGGVYVFVYDVGAPFLTVPGDITVPADGPDGAVVTFEASARDSIDGPLPVTCSPESGSRFPVGMTIVQCSATDNSANTASDRFTVHVTTDEPEVLMIHVPDPITAEAEGPGGASVTFTVTADGTSDPDPDITCDPVAGSMFALGTTTVNCVARDDFGNTASDSFEITVVDTTAPVLFLPDPIVVPADGPDGATVTYQANANDAVDGELAVACSPPSGSRFPVGTTTVQCSATDAASNTATGTFTVEVRQEQGTLMIHVPDPITAEAESPDGTAITFTVTADGTSDPDPRISCDPLSGSTFALGTTTVQCVATDRFGNSASDDFDVTVVDTMAPVISTVTASPEVLQAQNKKMVPVTLTVDVTDVADVAPRCFVFDVTSNEDITGDYEIRSDLELELRAERDTDERQYRVHVRCVDASMNEAESSATVRVPKGAGNDASVIAPAPAPSRGKSFRKWW